jgi:hypothetical protein
MTDHDQLFKNLLHSFLAEFIRLFFPEWAERFDFEKAEFLEGEIFTDVPRGEKRGVDVVVKLPVREAIRTTRRTAPTWLALIHVEVEAKDRVAPLRPRMFEYYWILRRRSQLPVLPIGLYLRVGLDGVGWDEYEECFWEERLVYFRYAYIGLPALDAEEYVRGENIFGVALAALMRVPDERRVQLKTESLRRIEESKLDEVKKLLLVDCVQTYLTLDEAQQEEFERLRVKEEYSGVSAMSLTWAGKIEEKALVEKGRKQLQALLERRYGPLTPQVLSTIQSWSLARLDEALLDLYDGKSLADLGLETPNNGHA